MISTAVILAAGLGSRLAGTGVPHGTPKGFARFGGPSLIERSVGLMSDRGVRRVVIVAGYGAEMYRTLAARTDGVTVVMNHDFAATGSMASLSCALPHVPDEAFLLLESDIVYEGRALDALLAAGPDAVLASGRTGAGDEVWVRTDVADRLAGLSKGEPPAGCVGEFVGICSVSRCLADRMQAIAAEGGNGLAYETDALVQAARTHAVRVVQVPDLIWGELDDAGHYARLRDVVWPALQRLENDVEEVAS